MPPAFSCSAGGVDFPDTLHIHFRFAVRGDQAIDFLHDVGQLRVAEALTVGNFLHALCDAFKALEEGFFIGHLIVIAPGLHVFKFALKPDIRKCDAAVLGHHEGFRSARLFALCIAWTPVAGVRLDFLPGSEVRINDFLLICIVMQRADISRRREELQMGESVKLYIDNIDGLDGYYLKIESVLSEKEDPVAARQDLIDTFGVLELRGARPIELTYGELLETGAHDVEDIPTPEDEARAEIERIENSQ